MQKKTNILLAFMCIIFLFGGCATNRGLTSSVTVNLVNYINQGVLMIAELERKSLQHYASVTGKNYTTDQRIRNELKDFIIPTYERFANGLKTITPEDEEIQRVHALYVNAADLMLKGFRKKLIGIEENNEELIIQANKDIEEARNGNEAWRKEMKSLYKKYGVKEAGDKGI